MCEEEATEEEKKEEKAAGAELKTKTPHNDVGKKSVSNLKCHKTHKGPLPNTFTAFFQDLIRIPLIPLHLDF